MSNWLLRMATLYFVIGVGFGVVMGATHDFSMAPVHAHINLLGWVTLGLVGVLYAVRPEFAATRLARAHFVLHNLALPVMIVALFFELRGEQAAGPVLGMSSLAMAAAVLCLALNVWRVTSAAQRPVTLQPAATAAG